MYTYLHTRRCRWINQTQQDLTCSYKDFCKTIMKEQHEIWSSLPLFSQCIWMIVKAVQSTIFEFYITCRLVLTVVVLDLLDNNRVGTYSLRKLASCHLSIVAIHPVTRIYMDTLHNTFSDQFFFLLKYAF